MNSRGSGSGKSPGSIELFINRINQYENWLIEQVRLKRRPGYALDTLGYILMGAGLLLGCAVVVCASIFAFGSGAFIIGLPICVLLFGLGMFGKNKGKEILKTRFVTSVSSESVESFRSGLDDIKNELSYNYLFSEMDKAQADPHIKLVERSIAQAQRALDKIENTKSLVTTVQQVLQEVVEPVCLLDGGLGGLRRKKHV